MTYDPAADEQQAPDEQVRTGVDRVDEVIRSVEELEERPIEEHVGVFEAAHSQLRRVLDAVDEPDAQDETAQGTPAGSDPHTGA